MPELPELEVIRQVLTRTVLNCQITDVRVSGKGGPIIVRDLANVGFATTLVGQHFRSIVRRGKFIVFGLGSESRGLYLVVNPKLTGRLQLAKPGDKALPKTHIVLTLANNIELRYVDQRMMGQIYLTQDLECIPDWSMMGPEPLEMSLQEFCDRIKPFRGEIKGILTRGQFIAGIGNAYADEILWAARIHPYRKRNALRLEEVERLYVAMVETLSDSIRKVSEEMRDSIHLKPREFLKVHMKSGEPCPRCGTAISLVSAHQRITNFCRHCQPGGLITGM